MIKSILILEPETDPRRFFPEENHCAEEEEPLSMLL